MGHWGTNSQGMQARGQRVEVDREAFNNSSQQSQASIANEMRTSITNAQNGPANGRYDAQILEAICSVQAKEA